MEPAVVLDDIPGLISSFTGDLEGKAFVLENYNHDPVDFKAATSLVLKMIYDLGGLEKSKKWQDATPLRNRLETLQGRSYAPKRLISKPHVAVALASLGVAIHFRDQNYFNALAHCNQVCRGADKVVRPKWTRNRRFANMVQPELPS